MSSSSSTSRASSDQSLGSASALITLLVLAVLIPAIPFALSGPFGQRIFLTLASTLVLTAAITQSPSAGVPLMMVFVAMLGVQRRSLIPFMGWTETDPLLVIDPIVVGIFFVGLVVRRRVPTDTPLSRMILVLLGFMMLEVINPLQGGIIVGLAGMTFYVVPILWYYVGKSTATAENLEKVLRCVMGIAIVATIWGLKQYWFGYADFEMMWVNIVREKVYGGEQMLYISGNTLRSVACFTSFGEYATFLCIGIAVVSARVLQGNRVLVIALPAIAAAIFLGGGRGPIITSLACVALLWAVQSKRRQLWIPRASVAVVIGIVGLYFTLTGLHNTTQDTKTQDVIDRQFAILDTTGKTGTTDIHRQMVWGGIVTGFTKPLGTGLGATTLAGSKFGSTGGSSELDISNMFISLGFLGGILYLCIMAYVSWMALRYWQTTRTWTALAIVGILAITVGQWLSGGMYAVAMVVFYCIGALDRGMQVEQRRRLQQKRLAEADTILPNFGGTSFGVSGETMLK